MIKTLDSEDLEAHPLSRKCHTDTGQPIPDTAHAVSVSLPSWNANLGYERGEEWVLSKMRNGYPRFFIHKAIQAFADATVAKHGRAGEQALLFPSTRIARQCRAFLLRHSSASLGNREANDGRRDSYRLAEFTLNEAATPIKHHGSPFVAVSAILFPEEDGPAARKFWQHTGEGISSRRAEFFLPLLRNGNLRLSWLNTLGPEDEAMVSKGPKRYQKVPSGDSQHWGNAPESSSSIHQRNVTEDMLYIEERFGRNLGVILASNAKQAIRRRIAGSFSAPAHIDNNELNVPSFRSESLGEDDVFLFPTGMSSIFNIHRMAIDTLGPLKTIMFGFPYIDTLKILENFGQGCIFYGHGTTADLNDLDNRCREGERFAALFCEFPGNPLLKTPDLVRIRALADVHGFAVIVDETIGNFLNVNVFPWADIVVSSLTKVFSGDSNVMGGRWAQTSILSDSPLTTSSCVLNPSSKYYQQFRKSMDLEYEDNYWPEDAVFMERNSRDFMSRNTRINQNAAAISQLLKRFSSVKHVYYPLQSSTRAHFDMCRTRNGGYGGLLSVTFHSTSDAITFFDALETAKGPSLGTNFTLSCPFVILAHYSELEWAASYGVDADLVRISVGLEQTDSLVEAFERALRVVEGCQLS